MEAVTQKARQAFQKWGRMGGKKRARNLSPSLRKLISQKAAQVRWGSHQDKMQLMPSVRLNESSWADPVYLEEILSFGSLSEWRELRRIITDRPFGAEATALKKILQETRIYGINILWRGLLHNLQGPFL